MRKSLPPRKTLAGFARAVRKPPHSKKFLWGVNLGKGNFQLFFFFAAGVHFLDRLFSRITFHFRSPPSHLSLLLPSRFPPPPSLMTPHYEEDLFFLPPPPLPTLPYRFILQAMGKSRRPEPPTPPRPSPVPVGTVEKALGRRRGGYGKRPRRRFDPPPPLSFFYSTPFSRFGESEEGK